MVLVKFIQGNPLGFRESMEIQLQIRAFIYCRLELVPKKMEILQGWPGVSDHHVMLMGDFIGTLLITLCT